MALFTLFLLPVGAYTAMFYNGRTDRYEELEDTIRERYGHDNNASNQFGEFYRSAILEEKDDDRIQQVLYAGKGEKKRFHKIDKELYGTEKGVDERNRMEQELLEEKKRRKEKRKRRRERKEQAAKDDDTPKDATSTSIARPMISSQAVTVASVGVLAAVVGFLLGGRRN